MNPYNLNETQMEELRQMNEYYQSHVENNSLSHQTVEINEEEIE